MDQASVVARAHARDALARRAVRRWATAIAFALLPLSTILDPEVLVVGGGAAT